MFLPFGYLTEACLGGGGVKYSSKVVVFVVFEYTSGLITLVAFQGKEIN